MGTKNSHRSCGDVNWHGSPKILGALRATHGLMIWVIGMSTIQFEGCCCWMEARPKTRARGYCCYALCDETQWKLNAANRRILLTNLQKKLFPINGFSCEVSVRCRVIMKFLRFGFYEFVNLFLCTL